MLCHLLVWRASLVKISQSHQLLMFVCANCSYIKWEKVGTALRDSFLQVGAINCIKHKELCQSILVPSYPTLVAVNSPGEPLGTSDKPAVKILKKGSSNYEAVMGLIEAEFPGAVNELNEADAVVAAASRELEQHQPALGQAAENVGGGASCILRIEDAAMSVRWVLKYEVFTRVGALDEERKGE